MQLLLNRGVFHYVFWSFSFYLTLYIVYLNISAPGPFWNTVWFVNENLLVINLLIAFAKIVQEKRLRIFSYISIAFKTILCLINALAYLGLSVTEFWAELIISIYWVTALIYYLYVSRKGVRQ